MDAGRYLIRNNWTYTVRINENEGVKEFIRSLFQTR